MKRRRASRETSLFVRLFQDDGPAAAALGTTNSIPLAEIIPKEKETRRSKNFPPKHPDTNSCFSFFNHNQTIITITASVEYTNIIFQPLKAFFRNQRKSIIQVIIRIINHLNHPSTAPNSRSFVPLSLPPPLFSSNVQIVRANRPY